MAHIKVVIHSKLPDCTPLIKTVQFKSFCGTSCQMDQCYGPVICTTKRTSIIYNKEIKYSTVILEQILISFITEYCQFIYSPSGWLMLHKYYFRQKHINGLHKVLAFNILHKKTVKCSDRDKISGNKNAFHRMVTTHFGPFPGDRFRGK